MNKISGGQRSRLPMGASTIVQQGTWAGLTAGFGTGPGDHRRYDRPTTYFGFVFRYITANNTKYAKNP
jgi:hypothetical protein